MTEPARFAASRCLALLSCLALGSTLDRPSSGQEPPKSATPLVSVQWLTVFLRRETLPARLY